MKRFIISLCCFWTLLIVQGILSYYEGFFTQEQIAERLHVLGLPFLNHGQLWTDAFVVSPVVSFVIASYSCQWRCSAIYVFGLIALAITGFFHWRYVQSSVPGVHIFNGQLTWAGWDHFLFAFAVFLPLLLFYFWTRVSFKDMTIVSLALLVHLLAGFQVPWYLGSSPFNSMTIGQFVAGLVLLGAGSLVGLYRMSQTPQPV